MSHSSAPRRKRVATMLANTIRRAFGMYAPDKRPAGPTIAELELLGAHPDLIRQVHLDYLRAGANVITSASYQASFEGFARRGLSHEQSGRLMLDSVRLVQGRALPMVCATVWLGNEYEVPNRSVAMLLR